MSQYPPVDKSKNNPWIASFNGEDLEQPTKVKVKIKKGPISLSMKTDRTLLQRLLSVLQFK